MKLLGLEFYKCRRRKIVLVCATMLAVELIWMCVFLTRQDAENLQQGWMLLIYNLIIVDAIVLPLSVATLASRNCELEHKGSTWKLLETMVPPGRLYTTKLCWGALVLALLLMIRAGLFLAVGVYSQFPGPIPWGWITAPVPPELLQWLLWGAVGGFSVCAVQLFFSLVIRAFAPPVAMGLIGGILGLLMTAQGLGYAFPYSLLCLGMRANNPQMKLQILPFFFSALIYTAVFAILAVGYIRRWDAAAE